MASMDRISVPRHGNEGKGLGQMLGALSIGLGVLDLVAAPRIARFLGMRGSEGLIRACGFREVVSGVGLVRSRNRTPWIWSRVGGDALDAAALIAGLWGRNRQKRNVGLTLAAVGAITALDLLYARSLSRAKAARSQRNGRDMGADEMAEGEMELLYGAPASKPSRSPRRRARRRQGRELRAAA
jgi:hypothetical protein